MPLADSLPIQSTSLEHLAVIPVTAVGEVSVTGSPSSSAGRVSVSDLFSLPQASSKPLKRRRGQTSTILTDSPYKRELQSKATAPKGRKLKVTASEQKAISKPKCKSKTALSTAKPKKKRKKAAVHASSDEEDEKWPCLVCCEPFENSRKGEKWIRCTECKRWAHEMCAGVDRKSFSYICDNCESDDCDD